MTVAKTVLHESNWTCSRLFLATFFLCSQGGSAGEFNPKPAHIEVTGGYFKVDSNLVFGNDQSGTIRYVVDESFNGGTGGICVECDQEGDRVESRL